MNGLTRVFLLAVALVGCHHPLEPWQEIDLSKAEKVEPSAQYVAWWSELETCSGLSGDIHGVAFYVVPNDSTIQVGSESYWGYWIKDGNRIVLAGAHAYSEKLVKHEEMHACSTPHCIRRRTSTVRAAISHTPTKGSRF